MKRVARAFILMLTISCLVRCNPAEKKLSTFDTPHNGTIHISVDESFKPVIDEQILMYQATYPGTKIIAHYKPEADCFRDLLRDSLTRLVIITRGLTYKEEQFFIDSLNYNPGWNEIAKDAVTLIVHANSSDTVFTLDRLRKQLRGEINREQVMVFDGLKATSAVRYVRDSILNGQAFDTSVVKAAANSRDVIDYVSTHENAIGILGVSWIGNPEDTAHLRLLKKVKIGFVECRRCIDTTYIRPTQLAILTKRYPLVRGLYYIIKENYTGLGSGFVSFLKNEPGQLIFKRAYLGTTMGFGTRNVKINQTLDQD